MLLFFSLSLFWKLNWYLMGHFFSVPYFSMCVIQVIVILLLGKSFPQSRWPTLLAFFVYLLAQTTIIASIVFQRFFGVNFPITLIDLANDLPAVSSSVFPLFQFRDVLMFLPEALFLLFLPWKFPRGIWSWLQNSVFKWSYKFLFVLLLTFSLSWSFFIRPLTIIESISQRGITGVFLFTPTVFYTIELIRLVYDRNFPKFITGPEKNLIAAKLRNNRQMLNKHLPEIPFLTDKVATPGLPGNIIIIQWESLMADRPLVYQGKVVTPFFDSLASASIRFTNFYSSAIFTSESDFSVNTSLHPMLFSFPHTDFFRQPFNSLPAFLGNSGYTTLWASGAVRSFWNSDKMVKNFGYQKMLFLEDLWPGKKLGLGRSDEDFLNEMGETLIRTPQPFFVMMPTLTSHHPFAFPGIPPYFSEGQSYQDKELSTYLNALHYTDQALEGFVKTLEANEIMKNSILIIYGDHQVPLEIQRQSYKEAFAHLPNFEEIFRVLNSKVPLIIYAPELLKSGENNKVASQIDVAPTILDLLGYSTPDYFLGQSMFRPGEGSVLHKFMTGIFDNLLYVGFEPTSKKFSKVYDLKKKIWLESVKTNNHENVTTSLEMFFLSEDIIKKAYYAVDP